MVGFRPQALTTYYATFEAIVDNAIDPKARPALPASGHGFLATELWH